MKSTTYMSHCYCHCLTSVIYYLGISDCPNNCICCTN
uniref:Uncharacterized protein n=1 Tax=Arundo donax TaxID=35708 RepID=A0A0A9EM06_ARUDO